MACSRDKILIVDDALENIEILAAILGDQYDARFATSGAEALEMVSRHPPDLILLDVIMPGIDGFEVCRRLKADASLKDIPIIFLTSLDGAADEEFGLLLGARDFIHKPVSAPVVLARVRNHLSLCKARAELKRHNDALEILVAQRTEEVLLRVRQLNAAQSATITAFCALAETRDNETGNHIRRTQNYVRVLAQELRSHPKFADALNDETIELLYKSAPLHDIGKVAIPDSILLKPGSLNEDEWVVMRRHCAAGRDAIAAAARELDQASGSFLSYAAEIAYCHHERWNGSGYPSGFAGEAIPLSARLMAIADVYDALISRRVYKAAIPHEEAVMIMAREKGVHFDPIMTDAMLAISDEFEAIAARYRDHAVETGTGCAV